MTNAPDDLDTIYDRLVDRITDTERFPDTAIKRITNFLDGSFNQVWVRAFSQGLRENQIRATAAQISGWVNYAGGPLTEDDLRDLDLDGNVDPDEINAFLDESDLDELVEILGVQRNEGEPAVGPLKVFTNEDREIEIPEGTSFGTQPDSRGNFLTYFTTEDFVIPENPPEDVSDEDAEIGDAGVDEQGRNFVIAEVESVDVGERFNVPSGTVTYLVNPPTGIDGSINLDAITGGVDRESNEELRERSKRAVAQSVGGGTRDGIVGRIVDDTGANDVIIEEFFQGNNPNRPQITWPHAEVVVDGGIEEEVLDTIADTRPTAVEHFLERPEEYNIDTEATLVITDGIDLDEVEDDLERFYASLGIGENLFRNRVVQTLLNTSDRIVNIKDLILYIADENIEWEFDSETFIYDETQEQYDTEGRAGRLAAVVDDDGKFYEFETDWEARRDEGITWLNGDVPDDGQEFDIYYNEHPHTTDRFRFDETRDSYTLGDLVQDGDIISVEDEAGNTYTQNTDYEIDGQSFVWLSDGNSPADGRLFTVEYFANRSNHALRKPDERVNDEGEVVAVIDGEDVVLNDDIHFVDEDETIQLKDGSGTPFTEDGVSIINADDFRTTYPIEGDLEMDAREKVQSSASEFEIEQI